MAQPILRADSLETENFKALTSPWCGLMVPADSVATVMVATADLSHGRGLGAGSLAGRGTIVIGND
jgi:hypothetical protein